MQLAYFVIIACGIVALIYGFITTKQVLAADAGTARMQEISAAVQEGARAYLNRQYTTIGIVGVVILIISARPWASTSPSGSSSAPYCPRPPAMPA
jgi:K(+)-stimulated pyrophosphate-energized sodium pump